MQVLGGFTPPPPSRCGFKHLRFFFLFVFTYLHDPSENGRVVHCAAVPATVPELVLALLDAHLGAFADVMDVVLVKLTQLLLALRQAHQLAAQRLRANDVSLRDEQRVHGQRPEETGGTHIRLVFTALVITTQMKKSPNEQLIINKLMFSSSRRNNDHGNTLCNKTTFYCLGQQTNGGNEQ